jgi:lipopolysaccharide/colanic/teichoic acid biosynthesis glycosyltransferase
MVALREVLCVSMGMDSLRVGYRRSLAFVAGVGFTALPTIGPFLAVLAMTAGRIEIHRADRWWWCCALLLGVPWLLGGYPLQGVLTIGQLLSVWLIFRSATTLRRRLGGPEIPPAAASGMLLGLLVTLAIGLRQLNAFAWDTAFTPFDAVTWAGHSALFGHAIVTMGALLALVMPTDRMRNGAMAIAAVGVLLAGAWEALIAWLVIAIAFRFLLPRQGRGGGTFAWSLIVVVTLVASGLGSFIGLGRVGFVTDLAPGTRGPNLFRGSEVVAGDWWHHLGVHVEAARVVVDGVSRTGFRVTKVEPASWARLQQVVRLEPGAVYTLSAAWRADVSSRPGLEGWGRIDDASAASVLSVTARDGVMRATATSEFEIVTAGAEPLGDGWVRGAVTFRYLGERPLLWYVGVLVDRSERVDVTTLFSEIQLSSSDHVLTYTPSFAERGVFDLGASRVPIWRDAVEAIAARPLGGWGPEGLPRAVATLRPADAAVRPIAAHAHNGLLAAWVEQGLPGTIAWVGLVVLLGLRAVQGRDRAAAVVLAAVLWLNLFDTTLLYGGVIYPLAAILGWRAVAGATGTRHETGFGTASLARLGLISADLAVGMTALAVGIASFAQGDPALAPSLLLSPLLYAALAWPLASWALGQYPGYGRPPADELRRAVVAASYAGASLLLIHAAWSDAFPLPTAALALATAVSVVLAPFARAMAKRVLAALGVWGRAVVIVGHGGSADRVALELLDTPLLGLHPIALVDTGDVLGRHPRLTDLVRSTLPEAQGPYASHVIVVPGATASPTVDAALLPRRRRAYRRLQVVPALGPLPASSVEAHPLGRTLSLEMRNNLAYGFNRAVKRGFDVLVVLIGGTVALPLLACIALAIRLDSPGPVLFGHVRVGRDGRPIRVWKFRSMVVDAAERLAAVLATDPEARAEWLATQKLVCDPRVTRVGRWLRATSLDELPQLWNVLHGEMSLVGPRPIVTD